MGVKDQIGDVAEFHRILDNPGGWTSEAVLLRKNLVEEEAKEIAKALGYHAPDWEVVEKEQPDLVEAVDAAADLAYVSLGTLIEFLGEDAARRVWNEVQRSNCTKFPGGKVIKRDDGKMLKPEGWTPPDIQGAIDGTVGVSRWDEIDKVNPKHYDGDACMRKIAEVVLHLSGDAAFCIGQAIKYLWRADRKAGESAADDSKKALWYLEWYEKWCEYCGVRRSADEDAVVAQLREIVNTPPEGWLARVKEL